MFLKISPKDHHKYFAHEVMEHIMERIANDLSYQYQKQKKEDGKPYEYCIGYSIISNAPLLTGEKLEVWIEYIAKIVPIGKSIGFDTTIGNIMVYDIIPDEILDKYNEYKKTQKELEWKRSKTSKETEKKSKV